MYTVTSGSTCCRCRSATRSSCALAEPKTRGSSSPVSITWSLFPRWFSLGHAHYNNGGTWPVFSRESRLLLSRTQMSLESDARQTWPEHTHCGTSSPELTSPSKMQRYGIPLPRGESASFKLGYRRAADINNARKRFTRQTSASQYKLPTHRGANAVHQEGAVTEKEIMAPN